MASSAVSSRTLSTSRHTSRRPRPPTRNAFETRTSSSVATRAVGAARRSGQAAGFSRVDERRPRPGLATEMLQVGRDHDAGMRHVDCGHDPEHVRAIVGQAAAGVGQIVRVLAERDPRREGGGRRANSGDLRARGGRSARGLQPVRLRQRVGPERRQPRERRRSTAMTRPS